MRQLTTGVAEFNPDVANTQPTTSLHDADTTQHSASVRLPRTSTPLDASVRCQMNILKM